MDANTAHHAADLANLAYDLYAEGLSQLRATKYVSLDVIETVERAALSAGGLEARALSCALCDYLAEAPARTRETFCQEVTRMLRD